MGAEVYVGGKSLPQKCLKLEFAEQLLLIKIASSQDFNRKIVKELCAGFIDESSLRNWFTFKAFLVIVFM